MINTFFGANLVDYRTIRIAIFSENQKSEHNPFVLIVDDEKYIRLEISKQNFLSGLCLYECKVPQKIELGHNYVIQTRDFGTCPLNVNEATSFLDFDEEFYYDGDDLGATYTKEKTTFKVWAPLASKVSLFIKKDLNSKFVTYKMTRGEKGVYSITLDGDCDGYFYRYSVTNSGLTILTTDPYAKGSSANAKDSAVINFERCKVDLHNDVPSKLEKYQDAIIYELHVRDFTIDSHTNIENKGKYLGLVEEGRTTDNGNPAGLDYLKFLGISHVQLLPIYDYKTVDELNTEKTYNWGYDPWQYFVPEGGFSLSPNDPYSRIIETKKMISALHKAGIKVNMDVVFNHVYNYEFSSFESIVPNYYFRKNKNGTLCNGSGCGDDLDTSRKMVRKLIIDAIKFWVNEYGIDGYRFDLMGLIDIDTILEAKKVVRSIKPDAMIYGEGWDMQTNLPSDKKCTIYNSFKTPEIAFFNDSFRDIVRGNNSLKNDCYPGYALGNTSFIEGFKFALLGSSVSYCYPPRFINPNQSINYCECHDNCTLFDKIQTIYPNLGVDSQLDILKLVNSMICFSFGVPFFHAGQEIGLSKKFKDNTYNSGDEYNKFRYDVLDERFECARYLKSIIEAKVSCRALFKDIVNSHDIETHNAFVNLENGALGFKVKVNYYDVEEIYLIVNPTNNKLLVDLGGYYLVYVGSGGYLKNSTVYTQNVIIKPFSSNIFIKKKK